MMSRCYAHRGFSGKYPENTMLAFEKAIEAGAEGIEFDVQLSKDGVPVIIHDETLDRTTSAAGLVCKHTYEQLKQVDASGIYHNTYGFQGIPSVEEYFEMVHDRKDFITNLELKTSIFEYPGIEQKVLDLIDRFHMRDQVIISSFNHFTVQRMQALASDIATAFLAETWIIGMGDYSKKHGNAFAHPIFTSLLPTVTQGYVEELTASGIGINVWTVNQAEHMTAMLELDVDGIITNYPDLLLQVRDAFQNAKNFL